MKQLLVASALMATIFDSTATPITYKIDPEHTYPSFEADHFGGLSIWRGKFTQSSGTIVLDRAAKSGAIDVNVQVASVNFGLTSLNNEARGPTLFDTTKHPTATYKGKFITFEGDTPIAVQGELTLHGVTKPLALKIDRFKCMIHPLLKKSVCGAEALAEFNRADYGIDFGESEGFNMCVKLQIQVEAIEEK